MGESMQRNVLNLEPLSPRGHWVMSGDSCGCSTVCVRARVGTWPLASSGRKSGMSLNILQCTGQPHDEESPDPKYQSAKSENP